MNLILQTENKTGNYTPPWRGVAQLGRALVLGTRCRRFESCLPDHIFWVYTKVCGKVFS